MSDAEAQAEDARRARARAQTRPGVANSRVATQPDVQADVAHRPRPRMQPLRLAPGVIVPGTRYRILRWLGDGGMGVVYEAEHVDIERRVALKILRSHLTTNSKAVQLLRDEARAATRIGSQHIVEVFDFAELPDGRVMFAMELLEGCSLAEEIRQAPFSIPRATAVLRQLCKGLGAAHSVGIVHCDVKPDNVLLVRRFSRDDHVKVLDFGIAALAGEETENDAGSPHYMAPERISGLPFDARVDMYSLGCTAFEMLTGQPPFAGDSIADVLRKHLDSAPEPPSAVGEATQRTLDDIVLRCLAKAPADRFDDLDDLEATLCEAQVEAGFSTAWDDLPLPEVEEQRRDRIARGMPHPVRGTREHRPLVRIAAGVGIAAAVGLGLVAVTRTPEPSVATVDQESQVEELTHSARAAAAKSYFVYPPANDPAHPTAYSEVVKLEQLLPQDFNDLAKARASLLRAEFASTLVRLGDEYWQREGGEPFAIDYYAQALVFNPHHPDASERVTLTPGELASLRSKAKRGAFTQKELVAAEPLAALAAKDDEARAERLERIGGRRRAASTSSRLERLFDKGESEEAPTAKASENDELAELRSELEQELGLGADDTVRDAQDIDAEPTEPRERTELEKELGEDIPDHKSPERLAREGVDALGRGQLRKAERLLTDALGQDPRNIEAMVALSDLNFERHRYRSAARYAGRAVTLAPRNAEYRMRLGDAYFKLERFERARRHYERAKELGHAAAEKRLGKLDAVAAESPGE